MFPHAAKMHPLGMSGVLEMWLQVGSGGANPASYKDRAGGPG